MSFAFVDASWLYHKGKSTSVMQKRGRFYTLTKADDGITTARKQNLNLGMSIWSFDITPMTMIKDGDPKDPLRSNGSTCN